MLLKNCSFILTQNKKREILQNYDILMEDDKIKKIGKNLKVNDDMINCPNKLIMPGLINTHTHLAMTLLRGYADDMPLKEWLEQKIWPLEKNLNKKLIKIGSLLGCLEMIKSGTTSFLDMYFFEEETAEIVKQAGLRAILCPVYFDFNTKEFEEGKSLIQKYNKKEDKVKFGLSPHSPYSCSAELLKESKEFASEYECFLHTHVSETKNELQEIKKKYNMTPVKFLDSINFLGNKVLAAHCVWLSEKDIGLLEKYSVKVLHCPTSNMKLASGIMPLEKMKNLNVSLGTDGAASNNNLDMFREMKNASLVHKVSTLSPIVASARQILDMATINGAKALNINAGSIEEGKKADIIMLDLNKAHLQPILKKETVLSHVVYSACGEDVCDVIVDGKILMKSRKVLSLDEEKILEEVKRLALDFG